MSRLGDLRLRAQRHRAFVGCLAVAFATAAVLAIFNEILSFAQSAEYALSFSKSHPFIGGLLQSHLDRLLLVAGLFGSTVLLLLMRQPQNIALPTPDLIAARENTARAPDLPPPRKITPRLSVQTRTDTSTKCVYVVVQNLGDTVAVRAFIVAVSGLQDWPTEPVFGAWEGTTADQLWMTSGSTRRVVAARYERVERKARWKIPYLKNGDELAASSPWLLDGTARESIEEC